MSKVAPKIVEKTKTKVATQEDAATSINIIGRVRSVDSKSSITINFSGSIPAIPGGTVKVLSPRGDYGMNIETVIYLSEEISPNVVTGNTRQYIYTYPIWTNDVVIPYTLPRSAATLNTTKVAPKKASPKVTKR